MRLREQQSGNFGSVIIGKSDRDLLISYNSELLQEICFKAETAINFLGEEAAASLQAQHSDIQAASNVYELLVGEVTVDGNLCTLEILNLLSITMMPNYPVLTDGSQYDWSTVTRIKLMGINDVS